MVEDNEGCGCGSGCRWAGRSRSAGLGGKCEEGLEDDCVRSRVEATLLDWLGLAGLGPGLGDLGEWTVAIGTVWAGGTGLGATGNGRTGRNRRNGLGGARDTDCL